MDIGLIPRVAKELAGLGKTIGKASLGSMYTKGAESFLAGMNWSGVGRQAAYMGGGALVGGTLNSLGGGSFKKGALVGGTLGMGAGAIGSYGIKATALNASMRYSRLSGISGGGYKTAMAGISQGLNAVRRSGLGYTGVAAGIGAVGGGLRARRNGRSTFWGATGGALAGVSTLGLARYGAEVGMIGMF